MNNCTTMLSFKRLRVHFVLNTANILDCIVAKQPDLFSTKNLVCPVVKTRVFIWKQIIYFLHNCWYVKNDYYEKYQQPNC